jgi:hypothetical protein
VGTLTRRHWLVISGIAMVAFFVALAIIEQSLPQGTPGIIDFEFVRTSERAARFLSEWGEGGRDTARLSLWVDYGFMLSYGAFFTLAGLATRDLARERGLRFLAATGAIVPYFAAAAALFDAAENAFLLLILGGHGGSAAPALATTCASIKFLLITVAELYALAGLISWLRARRSRPTEAG